MYHLTKISGKFDELSKQALDNLPDGAYTIDKKKKKRSTEQNAYIHAVVFPHIKGWWNDRKKEDQPYMDIQDVKDWVQHRGYWGYKMVGKDLIPKRSSEATTIEMVDGIAKIQIDFAKWGLIIPDPNQTEFLEEKNEI